MNTLTFLGFSQTFLSIALVVIVLIQQRNAGLSGALAGAGAVEFERRGAAKTLHVTTIVLATLFIINAIAFFLFA